MDYKSTCRECARLHAGMTAIFPSDVSILFFVETFARPLAVD